jgi:hypothetical protein
MFEDWILMLKFLFELFMYVAFSKFANFLFFGLEDTMSWSGLLRYLLFIVDVDIDVKK